MGLPEEIVGKIGDIASGQQEIKQKLLDHELGFFGRMTNLPYIGQVIRALTRPLLTWFIAVLFGVGMVLYWIYIWKYEMPAPNFIHPSLETAFKYAIGFWFSWRGLEKIADTITKTDKSDRKTAKAEAKAERKALKLQKKLNKD